MGMDKIVGAAFMVVVSMWWVVLGASWRGLHGMWLTENTFVTTTATTTTSTATMEGVHEARGLLLLWSLWILLLLLLLHLPLVHALGEARWPLEGWPVMGLWSLARRFGN